MKRRMPKVPASEVGANIRAAAVMYGTEGQSDRAKGMLQAADIADRLLMNGVAPDPPPAPIVGVDPFAVLVVRIDRLEQWMTDMFGERRDRKEKEVLVGLAQGDDGARRFQKAFNADPAGPAHVAEAVVGAATARAVRAASAEPSDAELAIVHCLVHWGDATAHDIAVLTGRSHDGGAYQVAIRQVVARGWATRNESLLCSTRAARDIAGPASDRRYGKDTNLATWSAKLGEMAANILGALDAEHPHPLTAERIAQVCAYSAKGGAFHVALREVVGHGLAEPKKIAGKRCYGLTDIFMGLR